MQRECGDSFSKTRKSQRSIETSPVTLVRRSIAAFLFLSLLIVPGCATNPPLSNSHKLDRALHDIVTGANAVRRVRVIVMQPQTERRVKELILSIYSTSTTPFQQTHAAIAATVASCLATLIDCAETTAPLPANR